MERYKLQYDFLDGKLKDAQMVENSRGQWVKYEDVAEALNIIGILASKQKISFIQLSIINELITKAKVYKEGVQ